MAYNLPQFNLEANIWDVDNPIPNVPLGVPRLTTPCQLRAPYRNFSRQVSQSAEQSVQGVSWSIIFPAETDVRDASNGIDKVDLVECPAGSGRIYLVLYVDDAAKGFENEYRVAIVRKTVISSFYWPVPIP